jgi:dihydroflavonol-4-reductase
MVFVTGGTGFLGAYILKNLVEKNIPVRAINRSANFPFFIPKDILDKVEWVEADVLDITSLKETMAGANSVIHAAAIVSFSPKERNKMYKVNIEGTENVVNAALESNIERLIHVSSVAALGRSPKAGTTDENKKWEKNKSTSHYSITKHNAEMHVWRGFAEGLKGAVVNPSTILGYGNWNQSSCAIFKNVYKTFPWFTKGVNGFVGVEDVSELITRLLFSDINEQRFIINAENWTFQQLFNTIADNFHKKRPDKEAGKLLGSIAWRLEKLRSAFNSEPPLLTKETYRISHSQTSFDNSSLLNVFTDFQYTPLETVIQLACKKYMKAIETGALVL